MPFDSERRFGGAVLFRMSKSARLRRFLMDVRYRLLLV
jgi:hypothetical protein